MEDGKIKTEEERMQEIEAVEANVKCMKDFTSPEQLRVIIQSFFHIHVLHPEIFIRQLYRFHIPLHLDVFDSRINKTKILWHLYHRL